MPTSFQQFAETIERMQSAVEELERACGLLQIDPLLQREWYELLRQKLLPQLRDDAFLVVAVVGGTNIGKSVIFNHIAGYQASATSPLASGTKHPVCLTPPGFTEQHDLAAIFEGFKLCEWTTPDAALEESPEHLLFWQTSGKMPANLLVLDTPDIDSDAQINWQRADNIRRSADVLIAVLTQQKYNDAAVKQFFRQSAAEDKAVLIVFNQCQLPEDDEYWPLWLDTFCRETGIDPEGVYVAPNDRAAAEDNRLPFYERTWPLQNQTNAGGAAAQSPPSNNVSRDLSADLSRLKFADIKVRSLRGALKQLLDTDAGVPAYLEEIQRRSGEFQSAAERLSSDSVVKVRDWPTIPNGLLVAEIRTWWRSQREGWARQVHGFYDAVGQGVTWPIRFARSKLTAARQTPFDLYRKQEWSAALNAVEEIVDRLTWMSESGNRLLRPRLEKLLEGKSRANLLERLRKEHKCIALDTELTTVVAAEMEKFQQDSPELYKFYRQLNNVSAAVRPMASVVMFTLGWGPAGHAVAPFVANAATHAVAHVVADFAGGAVAAVAGEQALAGAAGQGAGMLQARFHKLQAAYTARRAGWLMGRLKELLLGTLPDELQAAATLADLREFQDVQSTLVRLEQQLADEV
jgi:hypothetical protein